MTEQLYFCFVKERFGKNGVTDWSLMVADLWFQGPREWQRQHSLMFDIVVQDTSPQRVYQCVNDPATRLGMIINEPGHLWDTMHCPSVVRHDCVWVVCPLLNH